MRTIRLWHESLANLSVSDTVQVEKSEAHHFVQVLRGKEGDQLELVDGLGFGAKVICIGVQAKKPEFRVESIQFQERGIQLHLYSPVPKGKRLPYMLEKMQELGVASWTVIKTEHSVRDELKVQQVDKLQERMKEACKQSGCYWRLDIKAEKSFDDLKTIEKLSVLDIGGQPWHGHVEEEEVHLCLGPEAGWSDVERAWMVDSGIYRVGLSKQHLRMETAAIVGAGRILEGNLLL